MQAYVHVLDYSLLQNEKDSSKLYDFILREMSKMEGFQIYRGCKVDPYYNQLDKEVSGKEKDILKLARYVNLFCAYRNELVDVFKKPAYGMEMSKDWDSPPLS